jgi:uncharacterized protein YqfA (UPF0365 family)
MGMHTCYALVKHTRMRATLRFMIELTVLAAINQKWTNSAVQPTQLVSLAFWIVLYSTVVALSVSALSGMPATDSIPRSVVQPKPEIHARLIIQKVRLLVATLRPVLATESS